MKRTVSFLLAFLCAVSLLLPAGAFAEQAIQEPASSASYSVAWIAGALKILGIAGTDGSVISEEKLAELAGQIKSLLDAAQTLSDDSLTALIRSALSQYGVSLQDDQLAGLISLFRSSSGEEKEQSLASKFQNLQDTVAKASETVSKTARFFRTVTRTLREVKNWFSHLGDLFH